MCISVFGQMMLYVSDFNLLTKSDNTQLNSTIGIIVKHVMGFRKWFTEVKHIRNAYLVRWSQKMPTVFIIQHWPALYNVIMQKINSIFYVLQTVYLIIKEYIPVHDC